MDCNNLKISIVVPTYNVGNYIEQCLESIIRQTLRDIEIIVSDDCSTDETPSIISHFIEKDRRIKLIKHAVNSSASQCRKDAVQKTRGEYVMFVDGDDYLEENACEIAYKAAKDHKSDIVQFDCIIENCAHLPQKRIDNNQRLLAPYLGKPIEGNLLEECFIRSRFSFTIWNKIIRGDIARAAFFEVEDGYFPKANDVYAVFFILKHSKSYYGISNALYHYCFGRGMTGHNNVSVESFQLCCQSARVYYAINRYVLANDTKPDCKDQIIVWRDIASNIKERFLKEQIGKIFDNVEKNDRPKAFLEMKRAWGFSQEQILSIFAAYAWKRQIELPSLFPLAFYHQDKNRKIKTIGLYYHSIRTGGAQRVVAQLCSLLSEMKNENGGLLYRIVLITDEEPSNEDYYISDKVIRVLIPSYKHHSAENYSLRFSRWVDIVDQNQIDLIIYSEWTIQPLLWDMISIKSAKQLPLFAVHIHSFCGYLFGRSDTFLREAETFSRLADALVVLSEADRKFWSRLNPMVFVVPNPCFALASKNKPTCNGRSLLWIGRLSGEKQPRELLRIMSHVVSAAPDVICHMVGEDVTGISTELKEEIDRLGLSKNIILEGFRRDVEFFYKNSAVLISTSKIEGWPLAFDEAASFGVPVVLYDLPYLSFYKIMEGGWIAVEQGNAAEAAKQVLALLNNTQLWKEKSDAIYTKALEYEQLDIGSYWRNIFRKLEEKSAIIEKDTTLDDVLLNQISVFHSELVDKYRKEIREQKEQITRLTKINEQQEKRIEKDLNSIAFKVGTTLALPIRKLRNIKKRKGRPDVC